VTKQAALFFALAMVPLCGIGVTQANDSALACLGDTEALQIVRDRLESAKVYLHHARDNFGQGREWAIAATAEAIRMVEDLETAPKLEPSPDATRVPTLGKHGHPRMEVALSDLDAVDDRLNSPACRGEARLDALRAKLAEAILDVRTALTANTPGSHH
jgi:hypothetical protein